VRSESDSDTTLVVHAAITGARPDNRAFVMAMTRVLQTHADGQRVMILRDYHAENLLLLSGRTGAARIGILDFQLAQMGQSGYDLVSLLQDARRDVSAEVQEEMINYFRYEYPQPEGDRPFSRKK
jgi:aminoglycoside/choline kinase family phosphotransferase